ncbi:putative tyrosine phosphatase [Diaporthe ampelina]|uniref:Putative tyrosine phosphatase n=1 Tax=Diaporthe ampelina TaxID=1214573 RepID=A0A0G2FLD4_9PEZI|nr:putative tyrosine phosphatase [Diaporthe ampelina]
MAAATLLTLAETDVRDSIPAAALMAALQTPPFVVVPGTFNTRDLGLLPSLEEGQGQGQGQGRAAAGAGAGGAAGAGGQIRPGFIFRTGGLEALARSADGQAVLRDTLGVRRIFDLRSREEHARAPDPAVEGVEGVWLGDGAGAEDSPMLPDLGRFAEGEGEQGYADMYMDVLAKYAGTFREVLASVRDRPGEPILFHCTGLLETLAGYDADTVRADFLLSRIGTEVAREHLLLFATRHIKGVEGGGDGSAAFDEVPGFLNLVSLKAACWDAFVEAVEGTFGGFEGYATEVLGFSKEDLVTIKKNLNVAP